MAEKRATFMVTGIVRAAFVHLIDKYAQEEGQTEKYSMMILIPKTDKETLSKIKACTDAAKAKGQTEKWGGSVPNGLKTPLRDGDTDDSFAEDENFDGMYFLNCNSNNQPGLIDRYKVKIDPKDEEDRKQIFSGMYCRVSLNFFPYAAKGNKGVAAGLNNVQKIKDGEFMGGRSRAEDDFDEYDPGTDEDDDFMS